MNADLLQGFYLGELLIEPLKGQVTDGADSRHLAPKAGEVLLCLARAPGQLVTREALLNEVWGSDHTSQEALGHAISELRHARMITSTIRNSSRHCRSGAIVSLLRPQSLPTTRRL